MSADEPYSVFGPSLNFQSGETIMDTMVLLCNATFNHPGKYIFLGNKRFHTRQILFYVSRIGQFNVAHKLLIAMCAMQGNQMLDKAILHSQQVQD